MNSTFIVTEAAQRPASIDGTCFYCKQPIGTEHKDDCVLVRKKVKVRMTVEYEVDVPAHWDAEMVEFKRNESSWDARNSIRELDRLFGEEAEGCGCGCGCGVFKFEHVSDTSGPYLSEE